MLPMASTPSKKIVILGAGPTGLGAAYRLHELGYTNFEVIEAAPEPGGLARSVIDEKGFTWDMGGHVIFSHYQYFDDALDNTISEWENHQRESWVWMRQRFIAYPFQLNIRHLPDDDLEKCLVGLVECIKTPLTKPPSNFDDWILSKFGSGIADVFMRPYNFKVWAHPAKVMDWQWMGERVAQVDLSRVLHNMVRKTDDKSWGPNNTFRFPRYGGTGAIWKKMGAALAASLPEGTFRLDSEVTSVSVDSKTLHLSTGETVKYDHLITTMPMDILLKKITDRPALAAHSPRFVHSSSHIVGIGLEGTPPAHLAGKCWMYFPEDDCPFYRVTLFSHYSPYHVPKPGEQWSLMCEVSESSAKPLPDASPEAVIDSVVAGLVSTRLLTPEDVSSRILSRWHYRLEYGYPTPFLGRDALVHQVDAALSKEGVLSRGRFGAWKYEVANQDHSFMQGVEAVDSVLFGNPEMTFTNPNFVNTVRAGKRPVPAVATWR